MCCNFWTPCEFLYISNASFTVVDPIACFAFTVNSNTRATTSNLRDLALYEPRCAPSTQIIVVGHSVAFAIPNDTFCRSTLQLSVEPNYHTTNPGSQPSKPPLELPVSSSTLLSTSLSNQAHSPEWQRLQSRRPPWNPLPRQSRA